MSDLASKSIQIDAAGAKIPKVPEDTNQKTGQGAAVQLNIVEDDENLTSEQCCAPCFPWVFHDIEKTIRARKCRNPCQILKWIVHLIFWLLAIILCLAIFSGIVGMIGGALFGIGYLLYLGQFWSVPFGIMGLLLVFIGLCVLDEKFKCGVLNYCCDTSS